jgi:hypothetical protein
MCIEAPLFVSSLTASPPIPSSTMPLSELSGAHKDEMVVSLAALLLADSGSDISAEHISEVIKVSPRTPFVPPLCLLRTCLGYMHSSIAYANDRAVSPCQETCGRKKIH